MINDVARICHQTNKAYCESLGDFSQSSWEDAPDWQRKSVIKGVEAHMAKNLTPRQNHENWLAHKKANGWRFGPTKDPGKREHPCMVPYDELPEEQRIKNELFTAICNAFK